MTTERLSGITLLHAHKDMNIDREAALNGWQRAGVADCYSYSDYEMVSAYISHV